MTNSRSRSSRSRSWGALVVAFALTGVVSVAHAERKRVVVLEFVGPKGERFHDELVKLLRKTHTVVSTNQWNGTAEQLDAATMLDKDVRRVAKKLKVDAIVEGKIEKRRDAFLIHLKLREGKTGEVVRASIATKSDGPRIDARAQRDLRDELVGAIDEVEQNRSGSVDDDDARGKRRVAKAEDDADDEDDRPVKKRGKKTDERAAKKRVSKAEADAAADDEDDRPAKKPAKRTDAADDDEPAPANKSKKAGDDRAGRKAATKVANRTDEDSADKLPPKKAKGDDRAGKKVAARVANNAEDDEDKLPAKKPAKADARGFSKRPDDERGSDRVDTRTAKQGDDERALLKPKTDDAAEKSGGDAAGADGEPGHSAAETKVASSDDDGTRVEADIEPAGGLGAAAARSPGQRALELVAGASMTVRKMSFDVRPDLEQRPASYKGGRAAGAIVDATFYPLALGHRRSGILKDFGLTVMYDRVLKVSSRSQLTGMTFDTKETRLGAGLVFRHAFGTKATAPVVLGSFAYSSQLFRIAADLDTPNVKYTMFEPGVGVRIPVTANLIAGLDARFMAITSAGQIQEPAQYGTARVLGLEGALAIDYLFGRGLFARAALRYETIGYTFKGNGLMTSSRDGVASTQDVTGARDNYLGGLATVGYVY
jgi:hypothetical protein